MLYLANFLNIVIIIKVFIFDNIDGENVYIFILCTYLYSHILYLIEPIICKYLQKTKLT